MQSIWFCWIFSCGRYVFVFKWNTAKWNHITSLATGFAASSTIGTCKPNFCSSRSRKYFKCADCAYHVICSHSISFSRLLKDRMHSKMTWTYLNNRDDSLQKHLEKYSEDQWSQSSWQFDLKQFVSKCPALQVVPLRRTCCASSSSASCSPRSNQ